MLFICSPPFFIHLVVRCYEYNQHVGNRPLFTEKTARVRNVDELALAAPMSRFLNYTGDSDSFIDHFYDKLVHVCTIESDNSYLVEQANQRKQELLDFLFEFGRTGKVDETRFQKQ